MNHRSHRNEGVEEVELGKAVLLVVDAVRHLREGGAEGVTGAAGRVAIRRGGEGVGPEPQVSQSGCWSAR